MLRRHFHSSSRALSSDLKSTLKKVIPRRVDQVKTVRADLAKKKLGDITVESVLGGMRGNRSLYWESSQLDPEEGIRFHGHTIEECQSFLPKSKHELDDPLSEFLPESMFWFLLTGEKPTQDEVNGFSAELAERAFLPDHVLKVLNSLPRDLHPMTQLSIAIASLNYNSSFAKAYEKGIPKTAYWEYVFDDTIELIAKLPFIVGKIYQNSYYPDSFYKNQDLGEINKDKDWSYNMASMLGMTKDDSLNLHEFDGQKSKDFVNLIRLYCALHGDHEGGNASAHATILVGSTLADPALSYSAGVSALAGPLHGGAAQEVVRFITKMREDLNGDESKDSIEKYLWSLLNAKRVIPGYGHAVLRKPDPRFDSMLKFGLSRPGLAKDPHFNLVHKLSTIAPGVLIEHGKTKNPYPNVDSGSGILFHHYGITQALFFTVIFGASRSLGPLNQLIWNRILGLPIERPKSINLATIKSY